MDCGREQDYKSLAAVLTLQFLPQFGEWMLELVCEGRHLGESLGPIDGVRAALVLKLVC